MASNFRITMRRDSNDLQLALAGDFDGTSACELLDVLKDKCSGVHRVFIQTSGLKKIYPFGQDTFPSNFYLLKPQRMRFAFTGKNASKIAPENGLLWWQEER